jgi:hypothetical protein
LQSSRRWMCHFLLPAVAGASNVPQPLLGSLRAQPLLMCPTRGVDQCALMYPVDASEASVFFFCFDRLLPMLFCSFLIFSCSFSRLLLL